MFISFLGMFNSNKYALFEETGDLLLHLLLPGLNQTLILDGSQTVMDKGIEIPPLTEGSHLCQCLQTLSWANLHLIHVHLIVIGLLFLFLNLIFWASEAIKSLLN